MKNVYMTHSYEGNVTHIRVADMCGWKRLTQPIIMLALTLLNPPTRRSKQHCVQGHNVSECGRDKYRRCNQCVVLRDKGRKRWGNRNRKLDKHRRRARKLMVADQGNYTTNDIKLIRRAQFGRCYYDNTHKLTRINTHVEHMVPLSRGGTNHASNIALACESCNLRKHAMTAQEYLDNYDAA